MMRHAWVLLASLTGSCFSSDQFYLSCTGTETITVQSQFNPEGSPNQNATTLLLRVNEGAKTIEQMNDAGEFSPVCADCETTFTPTEIAWLRVDEPDAQGQFSLVNFKIDRGTGRLEGSRASRTTVPSWISMVTAVDARCERSASMPQTQI